MELNATKRAYIATMLGLVVAFIVFLFTPKVVYQPRGIYLPSNSSLAPTQPEKVKLFRQESAPLLYKTLGTINIEMHSLQPTLNTQQMMVRYAQNLAAKEGGKGIIINQFFHSNPGVSLLATGVLQGEVISTLGND